MPAAIHFIWGEMLPLIPPFSSKIKRAVFQKRIKEKRWNHLWFQRFGPSDWIWIHIGDQVIALLSPEAEHPKDKRLRCDVFGINDTVQFSRRLICCIKMLWRLSVTPFAACMVAIISSSGSIMVKEISYPAFWTSYCRNARCVRPFPSRKGWSMLVLQ